jgi:hypothetical protein
VIKKVLRGLHPGPPWRKGASAPPPAPIPARPLATACGGGWRRRLRGHKPGLTKISDIAAPASTGLVTITKIN